jgi:glycosyltransferase involved in cell wall biosynthesis
MPAYRQERAIERSIRDLDAALIRLKVPYEIIVVVDGQNDKTYERAIKYNEKHIHVVGYEHNKGKGYAVRYGMARSKGDVIVFIDAGGDIRSEGVSMLLEHFRWYNADIVIASKRHPASKVHYPWYRKILSWGYQQLIRLLFGLHIRDSQVGLKLFRRNVLEDVLPRLLVKRFAFDIEILAVAHSLGYTRIYEAPVELDFSSVSSITSARAGKEIWNMLWDTLAVYYRLHILHYYRQSNRRRWRYDPELDLRINLP